MTTSLLLSGYLALFGVMKWYADSQYFRGRQDERRDQLTEDRKRFGSRRY